MVRHVDVLPTLTDMLALDTPVVVDGTSLRPLIDGVGDVNIRETLSKGDYSMALRYDEWKIMYVDSTDTYYLYDLGNDPGGFVDVSSERPDVFMEMKVRIDEYISEAEKFELRNTDPASKEVVRQLKALGYL